MYITNLNKDIKEADLEELFAQFGMIKSIKIVKDPFTKESRGFSFITYSNPNEANEAIKEMSGKTLQDRKIKVEISKRNKERTSTPGVYLGPSSSKRTRPPRFNDRRGYRSRSRSYRRRRYDSRDRERRTPRRLMSRSRSRSYSMRRR